MTEYFTQFCVGIKLRTPEEVRFFKKMKKERTLEEGEDPPDITPCDIVLDIRKKGETGDSVAYLEDQDGNGGVDDAIEVAQAYLKKFDPEGCIEIPWANTASKHYTDSFGGDVAFVYAHRCITNSAAADTLRQVRELLLPVDLEKLTNDVAFELVAKAKDLCQR